MFLKNFQITHKKLKKTPQKCCFLMAVGSFFSAVLPAQNSPEVHFYFINSPIHSSVLKSVLGISLAGQGVPLRF